MRNRDPRRENLENMLEICLPIMTMKHIRESPSASHATRKSAWNDGGSDHNSFQKWLRILFCLKIQIKCTNPSSQQSNFCKQKFHHCCGGWPIGNRKQSLKINWNYEQEKNSGPFLETVSYRSQHSLQILWSSVVTSRISSRGNRISLVCLSVWVCESYVCESYVVCVSLSS